MTSFGVVGVMMTFALAADAAGEGISLTEKPGHTTVASVVVNAPPAQVYAAATDYARWPQLLHDIKWTKLEGGGPNDARVRFRSTTLEHEIAVKFDNVPGRSIRFRGVDAPPGARATGDYELVPIDGGAHTRIDATLYLDVVGAPGLFVRDSTTRRMRQNKLRADLGDVAARFANTAASAATAPAHQ
jgi:hypothetical protein